MWWQIPVFPALKSLKQDDCEFKASLGCIVSLMLALTA